MGADVCWNILLRMALLCDWKKFAVCSLFEASRMLANLIACGYEGISRTLRAEDYSSPIAPLFSSMKKEFFRIF